MTALRAALPMYDWPEVREATDALWGGIAAHLRIAGIDTPEALDRTMPEKAVWRHPDLLLAQTCGLPFATGMTGDALYVATPHYDARGCQGAGYCSLIVARKDAPSEWGRGPAGSLANARLAHNNRHSLSGYLALADWLAEEGVAAADAGGWIRTGSHRASVTAVANGAADLAAIDTVSFALAADHLPKLVDDLRIVAESRRFPGLPLITAPANRPQLAALWTALSAAFIDPATEQARRVLHITGLSVLPAGAYDAVSERSGRLAALGWADAIAA